MMFSKDGSIASPADLKGKTVAGPKGTTLHELLAAYLRTGGLTLNDVNFVSMDIPSARAALEGGSVDVALQAGPNAYNCQKQGFHMITNGVGLIAGVSVTATTQKFYDEHKELVDTFLAVQQNTLRYISENHAEAMQMAASATDLDMDAVETMYKMYDFSAEITDSDRQSLRDTEKFLYDTGMIEKEVNVDDLYLQMK